MPGDHLEALTPEQAVVAKRMLKFMTSTEATFRDHAMQPDPDIDAQEPHVWDFDKNGHYAVRVKRGPVIEVAVHPNPL